MNHNPLIPAHSFHVVSRYCIDALAHGDKAFRIHFALGGSPCKAEPRWYRPPHCQCGKVRTGILRAGRSISMFSSLLSNEPVVANLSFSFLSIVAWVTLGSCSTYSNSSWTDFLRKIWFGGNCDFSILIMKSCFLFLWPPHVSLDSVFSRKSVYVYMYIQQISISISIWLTALDTAVSDQTGVHCS